MKTVGLILLLTLHRNLGDKVSIYEPAKHQFFYVATPTDVASMLLRFQIEIDHAENLKDCTGSDLSIEFDGAEIIRDSAETGNFSYDDISVAGVGRHTFRISSLDLSGITCAFGESHFRVVEARLQVWANLALAQFF